ncbi:MAG: hypothetical protein KKG78_06040 [Alphaproteobacteria bacterium]|nr:hypothetical protein [Alphaproteobacteria bacterium]
MRKLFKGLAKARKAHEERRDAERQACADHKAELKRRTRVIGFKEQEALDAERHKANIPIPLGLPH